MKHLTVTKLEKGMVYLNKEGGKGWGWSFTMPGGKLTGTSGVLLVALVIQPTRSSPLITCYGLTEEVAAGPGTKGPVHLHQQPVANYDLFLRLACTNSMSVPANQITNDIQAVLEAAR